MLLLPPTQHPLLPKTLHAHGRVAMNVPLLMCLLKTMEEPMELGFMLHSGGLLLSAVSTSSVLEDLQFFYLLRKKGNILLPCNSSNPLTVSGIFCTVLVMNDSLLNVHRQNEAIGKLI